MPDYKIVLWNEDNFDVESTQFTSEAYKTGKYAFVSDYVRLYVLYKYGGIYMDTDTELIKSLDEFTKYPVFSGFENPNFIQMGTLGAVPNHPWIKRGLDYYTDKPFLNEDGSLNAFKHVIVRFVTKFSEEEFGFVRGNSFQILKDDVYIFPNDYFCPKVWETKQIILTENTHAIHHFAASWM
jgi:hypothetical protein